MPKPKRRTLYAYEQLRELIVFGRLPPGSRLIETDLADRLDVSRTPIREALRRLEQEGYITDETASNRSGAHVAPLTRDDANELFQIIGAIEGLAARMSAQLEPDQRTALTDRLEELNGELDHVANESKPDKGEIFRLDRDFHRAYVESGGGARLQSLHSSIKPQAERYTRVYISALVDEIQTSVQEHRTIIAAVEKGRADDAKAAVETNWRNAADRLGRVIDSFGERGSW